MYWTVVFFISFIMALNYKLYVINTRYKAWCIEKAVSKEDVLKCDKFPWDKE